MKMLVRYQFYLRGQMIIILQKFKFFYIADTDITDENIYYKQSISVLEELEGLKYKSFFGGKIPDFGFELIK